MSQSVKQCITVDLFPHILANIADIQKVHLLLHTPLLNKTPRLSSARKFVRLYRLLLIHCIYVAVTKPTCPAFSAWLDTGSAWSLNVTGKPNMFCSYGITIKVMANLILVQRVIPSHAGVRACQFWWKFYQELTVTMVQVAEGTAVSTLCPIERRPCWPKTPSSGCLRYVNWTISSCLSSRASKLY